MATVRYYGRVFATFPELLDAVVLFGEPFETFIQNVKQWCQARSRRLAAQLAVAYLQTMARNGEGRFPKAGTGECSGFYFGRREAYFLGWRYEGDEWKAILGLEELSTEAGQRLDDGLSEKGWQHILARQPALLPS